MTKIEPCPNCKTYQNLAMFFENERESSGLYVKCKKCAERASISVLTKDLAYMVWNANALAVAQSNISSVVAKLLAMPGVEDTRVLPKIRRSRK